MKMRSGSGSGSGKMIIEKGKQWDEREGVGETQDDSDQMRMNKPVKEKWIVNENITDYWSVRGRGKKERENETRIVFSGSLSLSLSLSLCLSLSIEERMEDER